MRADAERLAPERALLQPPVEEAPLPLEQPRPPRRFRTLEPLKHRDFSLFWSGALISNIGTWLQNVALSWLVLEITNSPFWVSMVTFCQFIPTLLFGLFGGLVADRADRRKVLLVTQSLAMAFAAALAVVTWTGHASVATLLPIIGLAGITMAFNAPSFQAIIPELIPRRLLLDAISLNSTQWSIARVFGPAIGGFILKYLGASWAFAINAASFLAVIAALTMIRVERHDPPTSTGRRALFGGIRSARQTPAIATLLGVTAMVSLFGAPVLALLPVMAKNVLGLNAGGYGELFALFSVGAVAGAISTATIVRKLGMRITTAFCLAALGVLMFGFGISHNVVGSSAVLIGIGAVYTMAVSATNTGMQASIPASKRGRVMSLYMMAWGGLYPVGAVIAGYIALHIGAPATLRFLALPLGASAIGVAFFARKLDAVVPRRARVAASAS